MKRLLIMLMALLGFVSIHAQALYQQTVRDADGKQVSLKAYKGQVMLIVNTATKCGFTPQYKELEALYEKYRDRGFVILDFPCNQFGEQAPGSVEEIRQFCTAKYDTQFPLFDKIEVNGPDESPLYTYLKSQQGFTGFGKGVRAKMMKMMLKRKDKDYARKSDIKWNFTKFLIDRNGKVVKRFEPTAKMEEVDSMIQSLL
ncbi:MAG: glutathione peroxidase [Prevotella sp.]|nr:glutathione peroxidase [Prevotella sp.]